jgi:hypothetical protein
VSCCKATMKASATDSRCSATADAPPLG